MPEVRGPHHALSGQARLESLSAQAQRAGEAQVNWTHLAAFAFGFIAGVVVMVLAVEKLERDGRVVWKPE